MKLLRENRYDSTHAIVFGKQPAVTVPLYCIIIYILRMLRELSVCKVYYREDLLFSNTKIVLTWRAALLLYIILIPGSGAAGAVLPRGTFPVFTSFTRPTGQTMDLFRIHGYARSPRLRGKMSLHIRRIYDRDLKKDYRGGSNNLFQVTIEIQAAEPIYCGLDFRASESCESNVFEIKSRATR